MIVRVLLALALLCGPAFAQSIPFPGPGGVAVPFVPIGTPASIGTPATSSSTIASIALTTTTDILADNAILAVVQVSDAAASPTISSISDGTNSLTQCVTVLSPASNNRVDIWYKGSATFVASGATLTATFSGNSGAGGRGTALIAAQVAGIRASPADQTATQSATTAAPTATTAALTTANELILGTASNANTSGFTEASGYTTLSGTPTTPSGNITSFSWKIVAATTAVTYAPSWAGAVASALAICTLKGN